MCNYVQSLRKNVEHAYVLWILPLSLNVALYTPTIIWCVRPYIKINAKVMLCIVPVARNYHVSGLVILIRRRNISMDSPDDDAPKSNHPLDNEEIKSKMWEKVNWAILLDYCLRFELISDEQTADLHKIERSPEIVCAVIVKAVKDQGERGYQKIRKAFSVSAEEQADTLEAHKEIHDKLPPALPPDSPPPEPLDAATLQRNWLLRHLKSMGKIDHTSIYFSSMLVDVSRCMELDIEAAGIFCLQSMKMLDGTPLFTGRYMKEADTCDNLFISMERNKLLHSRDGHVMEALCRAMDRPDLVRYISKFHSQVEMPPPEPDGCKLYLNDRFIVRTAVYIKTNLKFDDVLRVKTILSEHYKIDKHIFQFRGWMKGANSSFIIFWQFPYVYVDYLMEMILATVKEVVFRDVHRVELHMRPNSYTDITVYDLKHIYLERLRADPTKKKELEEALAAFSHKRGYKDDDDDDSEDDSSLGNIDDDGESHELPAASSNSNNNNSKTTGESSSPTDKGSSKRSFDGTLVDQNNEKTNSVVSSKKIKLACVNGSLPEINCF